MLDMLKKLFLTDSSESTGKRDLLQESQERKSYLLAEYNSKKEILYNESYKEVEPFINIIFEKVNKEMLEKASQGHYHSFTSFATWSLASQIIDVELYKEMDSFSSNHFRVIQTMLLQKLSLLYSDNISVNVNSSIDSIDRSIYVSVYWESNANDNGGSPNVFKELLGFNNTKYNHNKLSLTEMSDNEVYSRFDSIFQKVNKEIQENVRKGKTYSITGFYSYEGFDIIGRKHYSLIKQYIENRLKALYKGNLRIKVFSVAIVDSLFEVSVDWDK